MSIILNNINKSFGPFKALSNINLEFPSGELTALLGPSGSGKTTLLRIVAGLEEADRGTGGEILFDRESVAGSPVHRRHVGFVFQHYALFRHMTVFENIAFGLRVKPRADRPDNKTITEKVNKLLSLVQMESLSGRYPSQLSGGQRQRIALARALAIEPKVLLLDEPFGALDSQVRTELRRWLRQLHDTIHVTSIFVTHDQEEALEVADRIVVMNRGVVEQVGTPDDVFHRPASKFVMQFLGDVNVFHGRIESGHAVFTESSPGAQDVEARLLIRPHDLLIRRPPAGGDRGIPAKVYRVLTAGAVVKIELIDHQNRLLQVHLSHERYRETPVQPHEEVVLEPHQPHVYAGEEKWDGNYVI